MSATAKPDHEVAIIGAGFSGTRHILRCLSHARAVGATLVEVREEANDRYFAEMLRRRRHQIFWQDSCAGANSYYFDQHGDVPLRPALTPETIWRSGHFDLDDYRFDALPSLRAAPGISRRPSGRAKRVVA